MKMAEMFSKRIENTVGKGEIAHYAHFSFFQSVFKDFVLQTRKNKLSKLVENTVEKVEIAHCEQFLLFPQCFQKACFPGASKGVIVWEWVK